MDRLIIESVEGRIMLGITTFVAIMILIGWVVINEPARMAAFEQQHQGRSIERGAELFAANCSTCHGVDGRGGGLAPGINNPHLFGYSFFMNDDGLNINNEIARLQGLLNELGGSSEDLQIRRNDLLSEFNALSAEEQDGETGRELLVELGHIEARLAVDSIEERIEALENGEFINPTDELLQGEEEIEARIAALEANNAARVMEIEATLNGSGDEPGLIAQRQEILDSMAPAIGVGYLPRLEALQAQLDADAITPLEFSLALAIEEDRLRQVEWGGTIEGYITTTLIHGRPGSANVWPQGMVAWSQRGGGPLRDDEIGDLVAYMTNWDKGDNWTLTDLNNVNQFARLYADASLASTESVEPVELDPTLLGPEECSSNPDCVIGLGTVTEIAASLPLGDAGNGQALYTSYGCAGCHNGGAVGPATAGTFDRAETERIADEQLDGWTADEYVIASIIYPNSYLAENYAANIMTQTFGQQMTTQEMADIVAYLRSQG